MKYFILLLVITGIGCKQFQNDAKIAPLLQEAALSDSLRQYDKSIAIYTEVLKLDSTNMQALINRGRALIWAGKPKTGLADFDNAIRLYPTAANYYRRAQVRFKVQLYEGAMADCRTAMAKDKNLHDVWLNMASIKAQQGQIDSATYFWSIGEKVSTNKYLIYGIHYEINNYKGDYAAMIEDLKNSLPMAPRDPVLLNNMGWAQLNLKEYQTALMYLDSSITIDPSFAVAYNNRAFALLQLNQVDSAYKNVNHSIRLFKTNAYAYKNRALIYLAMKNKSEACLDLSRAMTYAKDSTILAQTTALINQHCPQ